MPKTELPLTGTNTEQIKKQKQKNTYIGLCLVSTEQFGEQLSCQLHMVSSNWYTNVWRVSCDRNPNT